MIRGVRSSGLHRAPAQAGTRPRRQWWSVLIGLVLDIITAAISAGASVRIRRDFFRP
jgi:hypothetical protein